MHACGVSFPEASILGSIVQAEVAAYRVASRQGWFNVVLCGYASTVIPVAAAASSMPVDTGYGPCAYLYQFRMRIPLPGSRAEFEEEGIKYGHAI